MPAPTLEQRTSYAGTVWTVTYAGMTRYFRNEWQALWIYELARMMYAAHLAVSKNRPS